MKEVIDMQLHGQQENLWGPENWETQISIGTQNEQSDPNIKTSST